MHFSVHPVVLCACHQLPLGEREAGMPFRMTKQERDRVIRMLRRAHALLDLDEGNPLELVARRYQVTR